jgi:hypothetical protein
MITQHAFEIILWRSLATFLLVGAVTGVVVSLLMIYRPASFERLNRVASKWISMRRLDRGADRRISLEQWFYGHHRPLGMLVSLGAVYVFVYFGLLFDKSHALPHLAAHLSVRPTMIGGLEGLLDAMVLISLTGAVVSMFVGLMLWLRPSALRGMEEDANRWVSVRRSTRFLDIPRNTRSLLRHNRRTGWLLLLGSLYLFFLTFSLLT